jgi:uncharacterized membrane protein
MIIPFAIAFLTFLIGGWCSYDPAFKAGPHFYWSAIVLSITTCLSWLYVARHTESTSKLAMYGLYWDVLLTVTYLAVPVMIFHARMSLTQWLGILLIMAGIVLTKV